ncbi:hypothetical protein ATANTOWER_030255 [Ataeniobius toweri]|uniref:Uncharacterized protein n=1 Tax=Ataeniobius toweri TaxID=208326 RepID=A0ABU7CE23_9TELE|nr:hypothetical protein [Ataeniobius toweri]
MFTVSHNVHTGGREGRAHGWWPAQAPDVLQCLGLVLCSEEPATGHTLRDLDSRWIISAEFWDTNKNFKRRPLAGRTFY